MFATSLVGIGLTSGPAQAAAPSNDLLANATLITGESGSITGTTVDATMSAGEPAGFDPGGNDPVFTKSVWYRFTAPDDIGVNFTIPTGGPNGISVGTFVSYGPDDLALESDQYSANGWSREVSSGQYETVAGFASLFNTDYSQDDPPGTVTYYVRVKSTTAGARSFTLNWSEGGLISNTTATVTKDPVAKTFQIEPSTTCAKSFLSEPPPAPIMEPVTGGYYIVRDESGNAVGPKRRWNVGSPQTLITGLPLLPGSHTYTVRYYEGSRFTYCKRSQTQVTVVDAQPTTTKLKVVVKQQTVTFTGSVTPAPPQGAGIQVMEKGNSVAGLVLKNGAASYVLTGVRPGRHTYTGTFDSPFPAFASSAAAPITVTVPKYTTTTSLTAPKTAKAGKRPTVKARVLLGKTAAQGSVVVRVNGKVVATRKLVNGVAAVKLPKLKKGKATVTVTYVSTTLNASSKASRVITVKK